MPYSDEPLRVPLPETGKHYRWLSIDIRRLQAWQVGVGTGRPGYRLVKGDTVAQTKEEAKKIGLNDEYVNELANRIQYGDVTLGWIPEEEYQKRVRETTSRQAGRVAASKQAIEEVNLPGVKLRVQEVGEIEERKKFARRDSNNRVGWNPPSDVL